MATRPNGNFKFEIDLRALRAQAERSGTLDEYARCASELRAVVKSVVDVQPEPIDAQIKIHPMAEIDGPEKSAAQIIEALTIMIAPIGVVGLAKLILQIVDACRAKLPTKYRLDLPDGGGLEVSGPGVKPEDLSVLQRTLERFRDSQRQGLVGPTGNTLRFKAGERDED